MYNTSLAALTEVCFKHGEIGKSSKVLLIMVCYMRLCAHIQIKQHQYQTEQYAIFQMYTEV